MNKIIESDLTKADQDDEGEEYAMMAPWGEGAASSSLSPVAQQLIAEGIDPDKISKRTGESLELIRQEVERKQTKPAVPTPDASIKAPEVVSLGKRRDEFTPEEMNTLKRLAPTMLSNLKRDKIFRAKAVLNPNLSMEGAKQIAQGNIFSKFNDSWSKTKNSDEYKNASLPQKMRMQLNFKKKFFEDNPEHGVAVHEDYHDAMKQFHKATHAHLHEKSEALKQLEMGGGAGQMSATEAAAHFGHKAEGAGDDDAARASTFAVPGAGSADPKAVAAARDRIGNIDVPEEHRDVEDREGINPLKIDHPALKDPKTKSLVNDFMHRYAYMMGEGSGSSKLTEEGKKNKMKTGKSFMDKIAESIGIHGGISNIPEADHPALASAVQYGIWKALATHRPEEMGGKKLHNWIHTQVAGNLKSTLKNPHFSRYIKDEKTSSPSAPVKTMKDIPQSEIEKLNVAANAPVTPQVTPPVIAPTATSTPSISEPKLRNHEDYSHLIPASKPDVAERLKNVTVASNIVRRKPKTE